MNRILNCQFVCTSGGHMWSCAECEHNIGAQCGATATDKTIKVLFTVSQPLNQQNQQNSSN